MTKHVYISPSLRSLPAPAQVSAAIVTCGGLCPGLNDVVQNIVYTLTDYGVPEVRCGAAHVGRMQHTIHTLSLRV